MLLLTLCSVGVSVLSLWCEDVNGMPCVFLWCTRVSQAGCCFLSGPEYLTCWCLCFPCVVGEAVKLRTNRITPKFSPYGYVVSRFLVARSSRCIVLFPGVLCSATASY